MQLKTQAIWVKLQKELNQIYAVIGCSEYLELFPITGYYPNINLISIVFYYK